ncbi:MAG: hypothetical protein LBF16_15735 [Pseudomonadales bacterium]|jgi:hypothetical protein|nr:hypothetical protein [Pseudomonadales bacterium]
MIKPTKKMINLLMFITLAMLFKVCAGADAEESLVSDLRELFESSKTITLKYIPLRRAAVFPRYLNSNDIKSGWTFSLSINCSTNCLNSTEVEKIRNFLEASKEGEMPCFKAVFSVLEFGSKTSTNDRDIYISATGECYTFNGKSYNTEENFLKFFQDDGVITVFSRTK